MATIFFLRQSVSNTYGMPLFINQSFQAGTILPHAAHDIGRAFVNTRDRDGVHEFIRHITDISDSRKTYISLIDPSIRKSIIHLDESLRTIAKPSRRQFVRTLQHTPDSPRFATAILAHCHRRADSGDNRQCRS